MIALLLLACASEPPAGSPASGWRCVDGAPQVWWYGDACAYWLDETSPQINGRCYLGESPSAFVEKRVSWKDCDGTAIVRGIPTPEREP